MPRKAIETPVEAIDKLVSDLDAEVLLAGGLGAIAASRGIVPPFTRLLLALNSGLNIDDFLGKALSMGVSPWSGIGGVWASLAAGISGQWEDGTKVSPDVYALAASGALEAMMMMSLVKNPGFLELVGKLIDKAPSLNP